MILSPASPLRLLMPVLPAVTALAMAAALSLRVPPPASVAPLPQTATTPIVKPRVQPIPAPAAQTPAPYTIKSILPDDGPLAHGTWKWDESNAPATGRMIILVDVGTQVLSVFRDGHEIGYSTIIYGADHKPTPLGRYPITQKKRDHWSNIYENAPMPYMLRMTNDGISIHGTEEVRPDYATNGCVGLPVEFARKLFDSVALGDLIIVKKNSGLKRGDAIPLA